MKTHGCTNPIISISLSTSFPFPRCYNSQQPAAITRDLCMLCATPKQNKNSVCHRHSLSSQQEPVHQLSSDTLNSMQQHPSTSSKPSPSRTITVVQHATHSATVHRPLQRQRQRRRRRRPASGGTAQRMSERTNERTNEVFAVSHCRRRRGCCVVVVVELAVVGG